MSPYVGGNHSCGAYIHATKRRDARVCMYEIRLGIRTCIYTIMMCTCKRRVYIHNIWVRVYNRDICGYLISVYKVWQEGHKCVIKSSVPIYVTCTYNTHKKETHVSKEIYMQAKHVYMYKRDTRGQLRRRRG